MSNPIRNAQTEPEILAAIARATWAANHGDVVCHENAIPTLKALVEWIPGQYLSHAYHEATERLRETLGQKNARWSSVTIGRFGDGTIIAFYEDPNGSNPPWEIMFIQKVHAVWAELPKDKRPSHPLAPLVRAWQDRLIQPGREFYPNQKASLPRIQLIEEAHLMDMPPPLRDDTPAQPWLPSLDPNLAPAPSWLLWLYDQCGGRDITGKRGAHWSFRLFIYAFLHLHVQDRDGRWRSRAFPQEQVIGWLHPNGWGNRRRDFDKFPAALQQINRDLSILPVGKGWLNIIGTSYSPKHEAVEFNLRLPSAAAHGASVDWPALLHSGTISDVRFRSHLSAAAFLDRSARAGHGITAEIGKAFRDDTGNPKRRRGGSIIRSATELEANPAAAFVRPLTDRQLTAMIGLDPSNRKHRLRTKGAFRGLHADGVIDLRDERGGVRIFEPRRRVIAER